MAKQVKVTSIIRKLYVDVKGELVEVKQIDNPEDYGTGITLYTKELVKGAKAGQATYAVAVADFIPKKRTSTKEQVSSILADMQAGMTASEIALKYGIDQ